MPIITSSPHLLRALAPLLRFPLCCSSFFLTNRLWHVIRIEGDPIEGINDVTICKQYGANLAFSNHLDQPLDSSKLSDETSKSCYDFFFNNSTFFRRNLPYTTVDIIFSIAVVPTNCDQVLLNFVKEKQSGTGS